MHKCPGQWKLDYLVSTADYNNMTNDMISSLEDNEKTGNVTVTSVCG